MTKRAVLERIAVAIVLLSVMLPVSVFTAYAAYWEYVYLDEYPPDWTEGNIQGVDSSTGWGGSARYDTAGDDTAWGKWHVPFGGDGAGKGDWWVWIPLNGGNLDARVYYKKDPGYGHPGSTCSPAYPEWVLVYQENHADEWVYFGWLEPQCNNGGLYLSAASCVWCLEYPQVWWDEVYLGWHQY